MQPPSRLQQVLALADFGFTVFVFIIASWAFTFLELDSMFWAAAYGYVLLRIALTFRTFLSFLFANALFLPFPLLCLLSVLWSDVPRDTLVFGIQLSMSVLIGLFIGMRLSLAAIFRTFLAALLIMMLLSLLNLTSIFAPAFNHENNFVGIFLTKSTLGMAAVQAIIAFTFGAFLLSDSSLRLRAACLAGLAIVLFFLTITGSATAIVLSFAILLVAVTLVVAAKWPWGLAIIGTGAATLLGVALIVFVTLDIDPMREFLRLLGRDPSLTGRTRLWEYGIGIYLDRPLLGYGAAGFWNNPTFASQIMMQWLLYGEGIVSFHNLFLELLVALGPLGVVTHSLYGVVTVIRAVRYLRFSGDELALWVLVLVLALYANEMTDNVLHLPHHITLIILVACGSALLKALPPR